MKRIFSFLILLLFLAGCAKQAPPAAVPEAVSPPAKNEIPSSQPETESIPEPETEPESEPEPEPAVETPKLPDLPYPVYCWGDTAVASDGTVILQVPEHSLELVFDEVSGKPAGFVSQPMQTSTSLHSGFYGLDGQRILTDIPLKGFHITGNLCWYFSGGSYTLLRLPDCTILSESLKTVEPAGDVLVTQGNFWNSPCVLVNRMTGETVRELDRGFTLSQVYRDGGDLYLAMKSTVDGKVNLIDLQGKPRLDDFHEKIYAVSQGHAVVSDPENNQTVFRAIDLRTKEVTLQRSSAFQLLPEGILAYTDAGCQLLNRQGLPLNDKPIDYADLYDWDSDGEPELVLGSAVSVDGPVTIILLPDGTELATLPTESYYVTPLSPTKIAYSVFTGEGALQQEARLLDLDNGTDLLLTTGSWALVQPIATSGGQMILCEGTDFRQVFLNDGTPVIPDLNTGWYLGGDVFSCEEGLRCLDGSWLYKPE